MMFWKAQISDICIHNFCQRRDARLLFCDVYFALCSLRIIFHLEWLFIHEVASSYWRPATPIKNTLELPWKQKIKVIINILVSPDCPVINEAWIMSTTFPIHQSCHSSVTTRHECFCSSILALKNSSDYTTKLLDTRDHISSYKKEKELQIQA